jgi:hypothetical protein
MGSSLLEEVPMPKRKNRAWLTIFSLVAVSAVLGAQERPGDKGETAEEKKLKGRSTAPATGDLDSAVTLDALLSRNDKAAFSDAKGATVEGWVVQAEKEEDGDVHLTLAPEKGGTDTRKWIIAEVTPAWQKKSASLNEDSLRKLVGTKVKVTGWLYYEPDPNQPDPRGTRWEIHPVTAIAPAK